MQLLSENLRVRSQGRGFYEGAEAERMEALIWGSATAEEALLKRCSLYSIPKTTTKKKDMRADNQGLIILDPKVLLEIRTNELKQLGKDIVSRVKLGLYLTRKLREVKDSDTNKEEKPQDSDSPEVEQSEGSSSGRMQAQQIWDPLKRFDLLLGQIEQHQFGDPETTANIHGLVVHVKQRFDAGLFEKTYFSSEVSQFPFHSHDLSVNTGVEK